MNGDEETKDRRPPLRGLSAGLPAVPEEPLLHLQGPPLQTPSTRRARIGQNRWRQARLRRRAQLPIWHHVWRGQHRNQSPHLQAPDEEQRWGVLFWVWTISTSKVVSKIRVFCWISVCRQILCRRQEVSRFAHGVIRDVSRRGKPFGSLVGFPACWNGGAGMTGRELLLVYLKSTHVGPEP